MCKSPFFDKPGGSATDATSTRRDGGYAAYEERIRASGQNQSSSIVTFDLERALEGWFEIPRSTKFLIIATVVLFIFGVGLADLGLLILALLFFVASFVVTLVRSEASRNIEEGERR